MRPSFFHHLHPPTIPARQARLRYTLAAGGLSIFLVLVVILTGILEMFYYVPTPESAGASIQAITFLVPYGAVVRNLHYWSAQLLVVTAVIHMLRVIFTGAYAPPRRFNFILGLFLLVLIVFLDFTGYILRWDEGVRWALVAGTNLIRAIPFVGLSLYTFVHGGDGPGPATLTRFYAWHIFGLTLILVGLIAWHIFRVRRDGGIAVPPPVARLDGERIPRFELVQREVLVMLFAAAILLSLAALVPAPLGPPMAAGEPAGVDTRAPWFFLWVQQLLKFGGPFTMGILAPLLVLAFIGLLPFALPLPHSVELGRWWPRGGRLAQGLVILLFAAILSLTLLAVLSS